MKLSRATIDHVSHGAGGVAARLTAKILVAAVTAHARARPATARRADCDWRLTDRE